MLFQRRNQYGKMTIEHLALFLIINQCLQVSLLFGHFLRNPFKLRNGQDKVSCRQNRNFSKVFLTALRFGIKSTQRINLSIKQIDSNRQLGVQGIDVNNRAPHGKVAGPQYHLLILIAHCSQLGTQLSWI